MADLDVPFQPRDGSSTFYQGALLSPPLRGVAGEQGAATTDPHDEPTGPVLSGASAYELEHRRNGEHFSGCAEGALNFWRLWTP